jgi:hypothetical protein
VAVDGCHDRGADYDDKRRPGAAIMTALQRLRDADRQITTKREGSSSPRPEGPATRLPGFGGQD